MSGNDHHEHQKSSNKILEKISTLKDDITDIVKERRHSVSSSRHNSTTSDSTLGSFTNVSYTVHGDNDNPSVMIETKQPTHDNVTDTASLYSAASAASTGSSIGISRREEPHRHSIEQLVLNLTGGGRKSSITYPKNPSTTSTISSTSLIDSTVSSQSPFENSSSLKEEIETNDNLSLSQENFNKKLNDVKECTITKIDPLEMIGKPTVVTVPKNSNHRTAMLLSGPKFRLNVNEVPQDKLPVHTDGMYFSTILFGLISLAITLWKPISPYFCGLLVGVLFATTLCYMWIRILINTKTGESSLEEWVEFPALESLLEKCDKEDKNTNIKVTGSSIAFQRYEADNDDDFIRYPCDVRLEEYRLIVELANKFWNEEKKTEKEVKFIGYREYLVKEAQMILVPEATLTRAKYWMNEYPIVIQNLQILDKQIFYKQQVEKSKIDVAEFFTNTATTLSIWFETSPQKEEWFHKLSLVLRNGKEDIERSYNIFTQRNSSGSSSVSTSSLNRRLTQTESDAELVSKPINESDVQEVLVKTQTSIEELKQKAKTIEPENDETDASRTHRTIAKKSTNNKLNKVSLHEVLQSPECLDEAAITINFLARRLLCDMFDIPILKDFIKNKIETKLKEIAISIFQNLRVESIDLGNTFPVILKVEPMRWNTQGIWFNIFLYYRGSIKLSIKTRVLLQKLINYDPKNDKPLFAQHHTVQLVHKDDECIDEDDLIQRQKLLAKEPEIPEMAVTRKLGLALTNLAMNKHFQMFANIPFVKSLFEKFSEDDVGADIEVTSFSGVLTLNIPPPPSDRIWVGFPEVPVLNIKVTPTYGTKTYSYILLQEFLATRIRAELKRLVVLPAMDDQLLPFFRDWVIDIIGEIVSKPINPLTDNYREKLNAQAAVRAGLQEYTNNQNLKRQFSTMSTGSSSSETTYL